MVKTSLSPPKLIHYGYRCDYCLQDPIVGPRFNCYQCNFDICQSCEYKTTIITNNKKHVHPLWRYDKVMVNETNIGYYNDNNNDNNNINNNKLEIEDLEEIDRMDNNNNNDDIGADDSIINNTTGLLLQQYDEERENNEIIELLDMTLDPSKYVEELLTKIDFRPLYNNADDDDDDDYNNNSINNSISIDDNDNDVRMNIIKFNIPELYLKLDLKKQQLILNELKSVCYSNNIYFMSDINDVQFWKFRLKLIPQQETTISLQHQQQYEKYDLPDLINKL